VGDAGRGSYQIVFFGPGRVDIASRILGMEFGNGRFSTFLRLREDLCEKMEGSWYKNKPT
jgi:hypothetical protein